MIGMRFSIGHFCRRMTRSLGTYLLVGLDLRILSATAPSPGRNLHGTSASKQTNTIFAPGIEFSGFDISLPDSS